MKIAAVCIRLISFIMFMLLFDKWYVGFLAMVAVEFNQVASLMHLTMMKNATKGEVEK